MLKKFSDDIILAAGQLLFSVAEADEKLERQELNVIQDILMDFFELEDVAAISYMNMAQKELAEATDLFTAGERLNENFDPEDKIDFIRCVFEVGFSDGELHYLEDYAIKKIADILNVEQRDLIAAKIEVKNWQ